MSGTVKLVWGDAFMSYELGEDHPLRPERVSLTVELIRQRGLVEPGDVVAPRLAGDDELVLCHSPAYIDLVRMLSDPFLRDSVLRQDLHAAGFGTADNPLIDGMHEAAAWVVGGSLLAAELVHSAAALHVFNPAGGLHHAAAARASGFCVYNDVAAAAAWLRDRGHRVAVVDVDAHHGDGTQAIFYGDPNVLTISLHESGRYLFPGTGFPDETGTGAGRGASANLPLMPYTWDEPWLDGFEAVVPALLRSFQPTILVTQDGCDSHLLDPLTHLQTSTAIWPVVGRRFHELAHEICDGRWVALGGGGYAVREVVPRAWTLLFAELAERSSSVADLIDPAPFPPAVEAQARIRGALERDLAALAGELDVAIPIPARG